MARLSIFLIVLFSLSLTACDFLEPEEEEVICSLPVEADDVD